VLTASDDKTAAVDVASGQELAALRGMKARSSARSFPPTQDGADASDDKTRAVDVASGQELRALRGHEGRSSARSFPPMADGADASADKTAAVGRGQRQGASRPARHKEMIISAQFSADGTTVLTASWDITARLWTCQRQGIARHARA